jgi:Ca2+-binding RTX toxin-like protein
MAKITANTALNMTTLNLNGLMSAEFADFYDNANQLFNGVTYQDVLELSDSIGVDRYASWIFGGTNLTIDGSGAVTGGTVTGYLDAITSSTSLISVNWALQNFSYSAKAMYDAVTTASTTDDRQIISDILGGADTFNLSPFADNVRGFNGGDTMRGNGGNDTLAGDAGADRLEGGAGNDQLNGGADDDTMLGGAGNDTFFVDNSLDRVYETTTTASTTDAGGEDRVKSSITINMNSYAGIKLVENLTLIGTGNVNGTGNALANDMFGNSGNNTLSGLAGEDILKGFAGADKFIGGAGRDRMYAGADSAVDTFIINGKAESGVGSTLRDKIYEFVSGTDKVDLRALDADTATDGDQAFAFSNSGPAANSIWVVDTGTDLIVRGDLNGNTTADFEIQLMGINSVTASDFQL